MLPWQHFCQGVLGQKFQFFVKNGIFLLQNVFISNFLARIRNQRLRISPRAKFQLNWTKDKGTRILTWNNTKNRLMTSAKFLWLLRVLSQSNIMPSLIVIEPQIKEKQRGAYIVPKDPSLNRVKPDFHSYLSFIADAILLKMKIHRAELY